MKKIEGYEDRFNGGGVLVEVDVHEINEGARTRSEGTVLEDIIGKRLHDDCLEGGDGLFAEGCAH